MRINSTAKQGLYAQRKNYRNLPHLENSHRTPRLTCFFSPCVQMSLAIDGRVVKAIAYDRVCVAIVGLSAAQFAESGVSPQVVSDALEAAHCTVTLKPNRRSRTPFFCRNAWLIELNRTGTRRVRTSTR